MTHVLDLANTLSYKDVDVAIAFRTNKNLEDGGYKEWLTRLNNISTFTYATTADLRSLCSVFKPQVIHAHSTDCFYSSVAVATKDAIPLLITLHSTFPVNTWYPLTLMLARWIIAVGPAQAEVVRDYQRKTVLIPNGIDLQRFKPGAQPPQSVLKIGWFGRVHGKMAKGVGTLNQALHLAKARGAQFEAYFVGSATSSSKDQFTHIGWLDDPVPLLQKTHIVFGHGRALREAMACGNVGILLGAGYGGQVTRELLNKFHHLDAFPEYGLPEVNPEYLANEIMNLIKDPELVSKLRQEARQIASEYFDVNTMADATLALYQRSLVSSPSALRPPRGGGRR